MSHELPLAKNSFHGMNSIPSLDGWRALAIIIVFFSHAGLGNIIPGGLGVTIFFFLSGFLITTLVSDEFNQKNKISIKNFYIRRAIRLAPPLFITLAVTYSLTYLGVLKGQTSWQGFFAQLFYFANYYTLFFDAGNTTPLGTGVFWSLAVEEHFYLIFPFVFASFYNSKNTRNIVCILVFLCILIFIWRYYLIAALHVDSSRTYYATDTRIDSIVYGCLLALYKNPKSTARLKPSLKIYFAIIVSIALLATTIIIRNLTFRETIRYSIQGVALAPLFYYSIVISKAAIFRPLNWRWMKVIGKYSYSIYLIHYILINNIDLGARFPFLSGLLILTISFFYAAFIDRYIDKYGRSIKTHFR